MREPETTSSGNSARPQNSPQGGAHIGVPSSVESVTKQLFMSPDSACDVMSPEEYR